MKRIFSFSLIFIFLLTVVSSVFAEDTTTTTNNGFKKPLTEKMGSGSAKEQNSENRMDNLKMRAEKEINRRIESMKKLLIRINEFKKLSATDKAALSTQVQGQIDALNTLLAKIKADTDSTTLKTDVQSIVTDYKIYALFMPKIQIMGAADRLLTTADEMSSHAAILETKINEKQTAGQNVTDLQTLLTDMKAKIADAKTQGQSSLNTVTPLTPDGFPGNKTQLQAARQMVVAGIKDLNTARQDGRKIIVGLLKFGKMSSEKPEKPTATPTP